MELHDLVVFYQDHSGYEGKMDCRKARDEVE